MTSEVANHAHLLVCSNGGTIRLHLRAHVRHSTCRRSRRSCTARDSPVALWDLTLNIRRAQRTRCATPFSGPLSRSSKDGARAFALVHGACVAAIIRCGSLGPCYQCGFGAEVSDEVKLASHSWQTTADVLLERGGMYPAHLRSAGVTPCSPCGSRDPPCSERLRGPSAIEPRLD